MRVAAWRWLPQGCQLKAGVTSLPRFQSLRVRSLCGPPLFACPLELINKLPAKLCTIGVHPYVDYATKDFRCPFGRLAVHHPPLGVVDNSTTYRPRLFSSTFNGGSSITRRLVTCRHGCSFNFPQWEKFYRSTIYQYFLLLSTSTPITFAVSSTIRVVISSSALHRFSIRWNRGRPFPEVVICPSHAPSPKSTKALQSFVKARLLSKTNVSPGMNSGLSLSSVMRCSK